MGQIKIINARLAFEHIYEPTAFKGGSSRYSATLLVPKTDLEMVKLIQGEIVATANEKWKSAATGYLKQMKAADHICFRDGDQKLSGDGEPYDGFPNHWYLNVAAPEGNPPKVFRGRDVITNENKMKYRDGIPYSGCYVHALVSLWGQDPKNAQPRRLNAGLDAVLFASDGARFGGGGVSTGAALDAFAEQIEDEAKAAVTPAASEDDLAGLFGAS